MTFSLSCAQLSGGGGEMEKVKRPYCGGGVKKPGKTDAGSKRWGASNVPLSPMHSFAKLASRQTAAIELLRKRRHIQKPQSITSISIVI